MRRTLTDDVSSLLDEARHREGSVPLFLELISDRKALLALARQSHEPAAMRVRALLHAWNQPALEAYVAIYVVREEEQQKP